MDKETLDALRAMLCEEINRSLDAKLEANNKVLTNQIMEGFNAVIENKVSKEIRLIAEQHGDLVVKLERVREIDELRDKVRILEIAVSHFSDRLRSLEKAQ